MQLVPALEQALGVDLPATLPFDAPTLREILRYVGTSAPTPLPAQVAPAPPERGSVYILGSAARLPGPGPLRKDAIGSVPLCRWDVDAATPTARFGGVVGGAELWDPAQYGITAAEALHVDPQQRLVLDVVMQATNGRVDPRCGVYVGVSQVCIFGLLSFCFSGVVRLLQMTVVLVYK